MILKGAGRGSHCSAPKFIGFKLRTKHRDPEVITALALHRLLQMKLDFDPNYVDKIND